VSDLVSTFTEEAKSSFVQIRNLGASYNEEISEVANAYLTNLNVTTVPVSPELNKVQLRQFINYCSYYLYNSVYVHSISNVSNLHKND
jgi:hypothetical protein